VLECQPSEHIPVLARLAVEFAARDPWFCSVPGETWPNHNFLHADA
jgi:phospholipase C